MPPSATIAQLEQQVLADDPRASLTSRELGASAAPKLIELASHKDPFVRLLALDCLREVPSPQRAKVFLGALRDPHAQVRGSGLNGLRLAPDPALTMPALQTIGLMNDPAQRAALVFIVGDMTPGASASDQVGVKGYLKMNAPLQQEAEAREAMLAVGAKLGDEDARKAFVAVLASRADAPELERSLDASKWIGQEWLIRPLVAMLGDTRNVRRVGVDARPDRPHYQRACDLAALVLIEIAKPKLTFDPSSSPVRSDAELAELRKALEGR